AAEIKPLAVAVLNFAAKTPDDAHAKEVAAQAEYALLTAALASQQPAEQADLLAALETANPKSEYMGSGYPYYLNALARSAPAKFGPAADKAAANFGDNQDVMVAAADAALAVKQNDRAVTFANKALAAKGGKADAATIGRMHYVIGLVSATKNQFGPCDKELRAAQPTLSGPALANAYYYLGICNYQLGHQIQSKDRVLQGQKFMEQAAAIPGPMQAQAANTAKLIAGEAAKMR
ncbi:MAG TPA: hypothetical protein VEF06_05350, partial [Bryobacteraceae bacterium]|nr:hypothetical protein [Bryobacteraceae bacterium]